MFSDPPKELALIRTVFGYGKLFRNFELIWDLFLHLCDYLMYLSGAKSVRNLPLIGEDDIMQLIEAGKRFMFSNKVTYPLFVWNKVKKKRTNPFRVYTYTYYVLLHKGYIFTNDVYHIDVSVQAREEIGKVLLWKINSFVEVKGVQKSYFLNENHFL